MKVELIKYFSQGKETAVGAARSCYSKNLVLPEDAMNSPKKQAIGEAIWKSTFEARHHTTLQHTHYTFAIEGVSRHLVWSFLHSHPYYNSEQQSQRYVPVDSGSFYTPEFKEAGSTDIYLDTINKLTTTYKELVNDLYPSVSKAYFDIFPARKKRPNDWVPIIKKKCMEVARYILPISMTTKLYHTISALTLLRYAKAWAACDVPTEAYKLVALMLAEVKKVDPDAIEHASMTVDKDFFPDADAVNTLSILELTEERTKLRKSHDNFFGNFYHRPKTKGTESRIADRVLLELQDNISIAVGVPSLDGNMFEFLDFVLEPKNNNSYHDELNLTSNQKITSALRNIHLSFRNILSHCADSQSQRHRTLLGSRPFFCRTFDAYNSQEFIFPKILLDAQDYIFLKAKRAVSLSFDVLQLLLSKGEDWESAQYIALNSTPIRHVESGSLLDFLHKWRTRSCLLAQEEIWELARKQMLIVSCAELVKVLQPPCGYRKQAGIKPFCPEGKRFCGVPVWNTPLREMNREI